MRKRDGLTNEAYHDVTKDAIETALILLMKEKPYHTITVVDICKKANVSRTFFYKYYTEKDEIIREIILDMNSVFKNMVFDPDEKRNMLHIFLTEMTGNVYEFQKMRMLLETGQSDVVLRCSNKMIEEAYPDDIEEKQLLFFCSGAIHNVLFFWAKEGIEPSVERISHLMRKLWPAESKPTE